MEKMIALTKNNKYFFPIDLILLFNIFTLLLFIFGPWKYNVTNLLYVVLLVVSSLIFLRVGFAFATNTVTNLNCSVNTARADKYNIKLLKICLLIGLLVAIPDFFYNTRIFSLSLNTVFERIITGFTNPYYNYSESLSYVNSGSLGESLFVILNVLLYIFKFASFPLAIFYWEKISFPMKSTSIFIELLEILKWIIRGMNKGLFDFVIIFFAILLIKSFSSIKMSNKEEKKKKRKLKVLFFFSAIICVLAITMFIINSISRSQTSTISYYSPTTGLYADKNNFFLNLFPENLKKGILSFSMYLTEGYQGLSYALKLPFEFNYFVGNNKFILGNIEDLLGVDIWNGTYMVRISQYYNWDSLVNWHSLYSWIANDVPFIFVPLVFGCTGFLFGKAWVHSIKYRNPFAIMTVIFLFIELFYTSANNQIGAYAYTSMAFIFSLIGWLFTLNKYRKVY